MCVVSNGKREVRNSTNGGQREVRDCGTIVLLISIAKDVLYCHKGEMPLHMLKTGVIGIV